MTYELNYQIDGEIATISESRGIALEVNLVSWNGKRPKIDIRRWDGEKKKPMKGLTVTREEAEKLVEALSGYLNEK